MGLWRGVAVAVAVVGAAACGDYERAAPAADVGGGGPADGVGAEDVAPGPIVGTAVAREAQRPGNAANGFAVLASGDYVGCGVPAALAPVAQSAGLFGDWPPLPGREEALPYFLSRFTVQSGVEVVGPNCFTCHANVIDGEVVIGAPATDLDYGGFAGQIDAFRGQVAALEGVLEPESYAELSRFAERMGAVAPYVQPAVAGVSPADNLAAILFAHRDPVTMAWSEEPLLEPPPTAVVPVDVPPWWRMGKKASLFYTAAGRGDLARAMMGASTLCVDDVAEARRMDAAFPDVLAYLEALEAPPWPYGGVDEAEAAAGEAVFEAECADCHGTYGAGGRYPNVWIDVDEVGTDATLAVGASNFAQRFVDWFNGSFFGELARLEPQAGYVAPPLDGIWATAPFLHNGSVPTLRALLDSRERPKYWRRQAGYDEAAVGFRFEALEVGHAGIANPSARRRIYDTTLVGYGAGGHRYGDDLTDAERDAVIAYLKTL